MIKKRFLAIIFAIVLSLSITVVGCAGGGNIGLIGNNSNYSQDSNMSGGIATSLESIDRTPIGTENLDREDDSTSILTQNRQSVVEIYSIISSTSAGGASGVIVGYSAYSEADSDGNIGVAYVLTCHHVIESAVYVNVRDINGEIYPAGLIGSNPGGDSALLWIKVKSKPSVAKIASSADLQVGETVYAIGNPTSMLGGTVTKGIVSALSREILLNNQYIELLQIDAAINGGSSGGGLFTEDGYLVGMTNSGYEGKDGLGFAVPSDSFISDINNFIFTYKDSTYNTYGYIPGVASVGVSIGVGYDINGNYVDGKVMALTDTGSWKNSGVQIGDKLVSVIINGNSHTYSSASAILQFIGAQDLTVGDTYTLNVLRDNQELSLTITVKQLIYFPPTITPTDTSSQSSSSSSSVSNSNSQNSSGAEPFAEQLTLQQIFEVNMYFGQELTGYVPRQITLYELVRLDDSNSPLTQNRKSVVEIYTRTSSVSGGAGSGVIIGFDKFEDKDGGIAYVVTNHHVIDGAYYANVKDMFGEKLYPAGLVGSDEYADIAVLYTELDYTPSVAKFCNSDKILVGESVYAIGNPLGTLGGSVSKGIVSALQRVCVMDGFAMELLQVDSALNNGSSGGGIFTEEGYLVAIANSGYPNYDGLGFAIPSNNALKAVNSIIATYKDNVYNSYGYVKGSVNLGVSFNNYVLTSGENQGKQVVYVNYVSSSGAFAKAGITTGDCIYSISYKGKSIPITDASNLYKELYKASLTAGDTLTVVVERNSNKLTIQVVLEQYIYSPPSMIN